jgi:hypothetical protein
MGEYMQLRRDELTAGCWYVGRGRNSNMGLWNGDEFLVLAKVGVKVGPGPRDWETRWGVKVEPYFELGGGCFQPFKMVDMGAVSIPHGERDYALKMAFDA